MCVYVCVRTCVCVCVCVCVHVHTFLQGLEEDLLNLFSLNQHQLVLSVQEGVVPSARERRGMPTILAHGVTRQKAAMSRITTRPPLIATTTSPRYGWSQGGSGTISGCSWQTGG